MAPNVTLRHAIVYSKCVLLSNSLLLCRKASYYFQKISLETDPNENHAKRLYTHLVRHGHKSLSSLHLKLEKGKMMYRETFILHGLILNGYQTAKQICHTEPMINCEKLRFNNLKSHTTTVTEF